MHGPRLLTKDLIQKPKVIIYCAQSNVKQCSLVYLLRKQKKDWIFIPCPF
jgi:hypothetical protein